MKGKKNRLREVVSGQKIDLKLAPLKYMEKKKRRRNYRLKENGYICRMSTGWRLGERYFPTPVPTI
jgi:hypothetical protein